MSIQISRTNKAGTSGEAERLRKYIYDMVSRISNEKRLRNIYTVVHRTFINDELEALNERQD